MINLNTKDFSLNIDLQNFQLPQHFHNLKLIYISLGTLGYNDTCLMKRLIDLFATITKYHPYFSTVCESLHFGKPMIVLPLFWDQHDNEQRLQEFGYGIRLDTYHFTDEQMLQAIEDLIQNQTFKDQLTFIGQSIQNRHSLQLAVEKIQQCARQIKSQSK